MIIAGIDVGVQNTRVVVMRDEKVIGRSKVSTGGIDRPVQIQKAYNEALQEAGITEKDVEKVIATGKGKYDVAFADEVYTETVAAARAAQHFFPDATGVMSVGADETLAAKLGDKRLVDEFVVNQKCAAGVGTYISYLGKRLGLTDEQIAAADGADAGIMNDGCTVFAELDALSMLNNGAQPQSIMATALRAAATRAATVLADLSASPGENVVLFGGLVDNPAFVSALEKSLNRKFLVSKEAEYGGAIGAVICGTKGI